MAQKVKISSYVRNVGKSFGYAVRDVVGDYSPVITSTARETSSTISDIKISMQEMKNNNISKATRDFGKTENFLSNTLDDLKSGKWYNQERKDKAIDDMFGSDFDFDFDEDWGDSDDDSSKDSAVIEHDEMNSRQIISSMGQVGSDISRSVGYASAKSAEYIVANNNASTRALYDLNARGFNQVSAILLNMSGSLNGLIQLGEPLAVHMQNSSVFYTNTTSSLNKINEGVDKLNSNLQILVDRTAYMDKKASGKESKNGFGSVMSGGQFNASGYIGMVKDNLKEQTDTFKSLVDMMKMVLGENGKNTSLTEMLVKGGIDKMIPNITKEVMKQFDETISMTLGNGLMRAGKSVRGKGGFLTTLLADVFLPKETVKNNINPSNYEKGPIQWDGIARQSLTYVIPTYLAQMTALLAGVNDERDYQYYDFRSGKFTTKRLYNRDKEQRDRSKANLAGGEFKRTAMNAAGTAKQQQEIEEFFYQAMMQGGDFYDFKRGKTDENWRKKYGVSEETVELLLGLLSDNNGKSPNKNRNMASKWETELNALIAERAKQMMEEEMLGYSFESHNIDGSDNFVLRSAVGGSRGGKRGAGEINRSVYKNGFQSASESYAPKKKWRDNGDGTYTVGNNDAVISADDFSKWIKAFESGDISTMKKIENSKAMKDAKAKAGSMARDIGKNLTDKIPGGERVTNIAELLQTGKDVVQTPMYAVTMAMDTLNRGLNNLFWGDGSEEGVVDKLKKKINSVWESIKSKFDDVFGNKTTRALNDMGLSDLYVDIVKRVDKKGIMRYYGVDEAGKLHRVSDSVGKTFEENTRKKSLKEAMSDEWQNIKQYAKNSFSRARERRESFKAELAQFKEQAASYDNGNAAGGRQITKSGIAIVSEGELIVPSEFNPFYHGTTNKSSQIANEARIRRNFFGSFAKGGVVGDDTGKKRIGSSNIYIDKDGAYYEDDNKLNIKDKDSRGKIKSAYGNAIANSGPVGAITEGAKTLTSGIMDFVNQVIGKNDKSKTEQEKKNIFEKMKQSFVDAGDEKGALGIGAVTGVGVSLLTGAVVGPLAGAAIGAGVGLAVKSKAFQDLLFGTGDPDSDEYKQGLLGSIGQKLKEGNNMDILKSSGIGGGAGLVAGTLMGSPILGMIAGSSIGYVVKSEKAQEFLFGTEDEKTSLGILKDKVKENAPNIAAGALGGLLLGPFGVVGNLLVGSGLGYLSTTSDFKKFMFGDPDNKNDKGLAGKLHDKIFNPLDEIMHNLKNAITGFTKRMGIRLLGLTKKVGSWIKSKIDKAGEGKGLLGKTIRGVKKIGGGLINGTIGLVGGTLDKIDTGLKKSNLNTGSSVYNRALGRNETAQERLATRQTIRNGGVETEEGPNGETLYYKVNANGTRKLINQKKYDAIVAKNEKGKKWKENSKFGKIDKAISGMSEDEISKLTKKGGKEDARLALAGILGKDANKIKDTDLAQFISLLGDEKSRFSDENKQKDKEKDEKQFKDIVRDKAEEMADSLDSLVVNVATIAHKIDPTAEIDTGSDGGSGKTGIGRGLQKLKNIFGKKSGDNSDESDEGGAGSAIYKNIMRNLSGGSSGERKTEFTNNGPVQYVKNSQGEWVVDRSDSDTKATMKKQNAFNESISGIGKITGILGGIGGALGFLKKGLLGDGEKKPGLLGKLFNGLFGEDGALPGIIGFITGGVKGPLKNMVKTVFSTGTATLVKNLFIDAGIGALVAGAFSGMFDGLASNIVGLIGGKGAEDAYADKSKSETRTYDVTLEDGSTVTASKDENGNFVDANGNPLDVKSVDGSNQNNVASFSDKLKENTVRGILTNTRTAAGAVLRKTNVGKAITKFATENADNLGIAIFTQIDDALIKVAGALKKLPVLKNVDLDGMFGSLSKKIGETITSQSAANVAKFASNAVVIARIAFAVVDFTTGYEDARTTLGIVKEPTTGQRIISGLLRLVKNLIPIVGSLIPDSLVIDVFCNYVAPALGIDVSELMNAREEAQQTVDSYNEATGKNLSVAEFTKSVMKDYTWTERLGNAASTTWEDTKVKAKNFGKSVKENGLGATLKQMGSDTVDAFKDSYKENGGGLAGIMSGIGTTFGNMLPGVLGEIVKANADIRSKAFKGDLKGLWGISLQDFSGGGEDIEGTDLQTAVPSMFSKAIGQLPLIVNKVISTPIALLFKVIGKVKEGIQPVIDKVKEFGTGLYTITKDNLSYIVSGDIKGLWSGKDENGDDKENPLGGFGKVISGIEKVTYTVPTAISWVGHKVYDGIKGIVNGVKSSINTFTSSENAGEDLIKGKKSLSEFLDVSNIKDEEGNPVGGFMKVIATVGRITSVPVMIFKKIGNDIKERFEAIKTGVKNVATDTFNNVLTLNNISKTGNFSNLLDNEIQVSEDNPLGGFMKVVNGVQKFAFLIPTLFHKVGNSVKERFEAIKTGVKNVATDTFNNVLTLNNISKTGEIGTLWDNEIKVSEDNPLGGFMNVVNGVQKFAFTIPTLFHKVGNSVKERFEAIKTGVKNVATDTFNNTIKLNNISKTGNFSNLWDNEIQVSEDNPLGGFMNVVNGAQKFAFTIPTLFHKVGNSVKEKFNEIKTGVSNIGTDITNNNITLGDISKTGELGTLWDNEIQVSEDNPLGGFMGAVNVGQKLMFTIPTLVHKVGNGIHSVIDSVIGDVQSETGLFNTAIDELKTASESGEIGKVTETEYTPSVDGPLSFIFTAAFGINKAFNVVVAAFNKIAKPIKDVVEGVTDTVGGIVDKVKDVAEDSWDSLKEGVSNIWGSFTDWVSGGNSGLLPAGGDSGFVNQYDPKYQHYNVSGERFASKGCGPAVASMAASALGKNLSVGDAVRASNGYQVNNGVTLDYFQNALGSKGINTEIIAGGSSADMYSKIASGQKVILLGRDASNTSKTNSPFGPNNHYVLATGIDRRGNVIVNDPESKGPRTYSPNILNSASYGIAGSNSGLRGRYSPIFKYIAGGDSDNVAAQVWYYLINHGFSEQAAAGVMGNLKQESNMNPSLDKPSVTCGIACWDYQNGQNAMKNAASAAGKNWQDLAFQLDYLCASAPEQFNTYTGRSKHVYSTGEWCWWPTKMTWEEYKQLKSVNDAAEIFERVFERASKPMIANRQKYANEYYTQYTGKSGEPISSSGATFGDTSSSGGILGIVNTITSAFTNAFPGNSGSRNAAATYGTDGTNVGSTTGTTYNPVNPNFSSKSPVDWMKSILGKISYSMSGPRDPEKGSADCSSTVNWAIRKAGGPDIGGSTLAQLDNGNLSTVWDGNGSYATDAVQSSMQPNDVIFFSRPTSDFTKGRKYRVGHVGLYEGNGKYIDHGSGMGPQEKTLKFGTDGKIVRVSRIKTSGAGSGIASYNDLAMAAGGSSGLLLASRAGSNAPGTVTIRDSRSGRLIPIGRASGGASDITTLTSNMLHNVKTDVTNKAQSGTVSSDLVAQLLQAITNILNNIADNTAPVNKIYQALSAYISSGGGSAMEKVTVNKQPKQQVVQQPTEVDSNIAALAGVLAELAKG